MSRARRRRLAGIWLVLAALLAGIWLQERADQASMAPPEREIGSGHALFDFGETDLSRIEILYGPRYAVLLRDDAGAWMLHDASHRHTAGSDDATGSHQPHVADPAMVEEMTRQVTLATEMRADQRVTPDRPIEAYGLEKPQAVVLFLGRAEAGKPEPLLAELLVGDLLPSQFSYYARRSGDGDLWLVPRYRIALLLAAAFGEDQAPSLLPPADPKPGQ